MRILWVASQLGWEGGIGRVVAGATQALAVRGHEVWVAGMSKDGTPPPLEGVCVQAWSRRRWKAAQLPRLLALVQRTQPHVIHFHAATAHGELIAPLIASRGCFGWPVVFVTPHTGNRAHHPKRRVRLGIRAANGVIATSRWSGEHAVAAGARRDRVTVAHAGIDLPPEPDFAARRAEILFLGRLRPEKGVHVLIDAFALVAPGRPDWRLQIAGAGREAENLRERAGQSGFASRIDFLGQVKGAEKEEVIARAAIGALPSRIESYGAALLELEAAGVPCVATDVGGLRDVMDDGRLGRLVPWNDTQAFAKALAELMDNAELRHRLGRAARAFAAARSWDAMAERLESIYTGKPQSEREQRG
jgi:glycosyltransferase involved in cell wall biosynthesis